MISNRSAIAAPGEAYVWIWLPNATDPVVAGRLWRDGERFLFNYGQSYLRRPDAIAILDSELPLRAGPLAPADGLSLAGCLRDAAPDAWGRRVVLNRLFGLKGPGVETANLDELSYLLLSGSNRIGALDFQVSATVYEPRETPTSALHDLMIASERVDRGEPIPHDVDLALFHGSSLGGARPKAMLRDGDSEWIAKFSASSDTYNVVKAEFVAMRLAAEVGLSVAPVRLRAVAGRDVLLVRRFDRRRVDRGWQRSAVVSALTLLRLDELMARYASYEDFAEIVRHRFAAPAETLRDLFGRLVFSILVGNTDDHARNHAAFWDGRCLHLTPAYDICPQFRSGGQASQAMAIMDDDRRSRLAVCLAAAARFGLSREAAETLIRDQIEAMGRAWPRIAEEADLSAIDRSLLAGRLFLHPYIFEEGADHLATRLEQA